MLLSCFWKGWICMMHISHVCTYNLRSQQPGFCPGVPNKSHCLIVNSPLLGQWGLIVVYLLVWNVWFLTISVGKLSPDKDFGKGQCFQWIDSPWLGLLSGNYRETGTCKLQLGIWHCSSTTRGLKVRDVGEFVREWGERKFHNSTTYLGPEYCPRNEN